MGVQPDPDGLREGSIQEIADPGLVVEQRHDVALMFQMVDDRRKKPRESGFAGEPRNLMKGLWGVNS